jgi:hypothetical protein
MKEEEAAAAAADKSDRHKIERAYMDDLLDAKVGD